MSETAPASARGSVLAAWCWALAASAGLGLSFPKPGLWVLLLPSLAVVFGFLAAPVTPRRAMLRGWICGSVFYSILLSWFADVLLGFTQLGLLVALVAVLSSGMLLGLGVAGCAWIARRVAQFAGSPAPGLWLLPVLWCGYELVRLRVPAPFPWGTLSAAFAQTYSAVTLARAIGSFGVSLLLALCAAFIAHAFLVRRGTRAIGVMGLACAALAFVAGWALKPDPQVGRTVRVGVVQGSLDREQMAMEKLLTYVALTKEAADRGAQVVVWPESATGLRIDTDEAYRSLLESTAAAHGIDLVVGTTLRRDESAYFNGAALVRPDLGETSRSAKRFLVPFGEYLPFQRYLGRLRAIADESGNFVPGDKEVVHGGKHARIGALICYESVFPEIPCGLERSGMELLVNMTNDSWFGEGSGVHQHLYHGLLRVAETRRPMARAANTGVSAIVGADGHVIARAETMEQAVLVEDVSVAALRAWGCLGGRVLAWLCASLCVLALAVAVWPQRRSREPAVQADPWPPDAHQVTDS